MPIFQAPQGVTSVSVGGTEYVVSNSRVDVSPEHAAEIGHLGFIPVHDPDPVGDQKPEGSQQSNDEPPEGSTNQDDQAPPLDDSAQNPDQTDPQPEQPPVDPAATADGAAPSSDDVGQPQTDQTDPQPKGKGKKNSRLTAWQH